MIVAIHHFFYTMPNKNIDTHSTSKGQIQLIFGPMFSGKTTELIRRLRRYQIANYKCLIVKYANDDRYKSTGIVSHDHQSLPAVSVRQISELQTKSNDYDVIGIDEGQFFPDITDCCEQLAENGKIVVVAALDGSFQRVGFGNILNLVPLAESVIKLNAVCMVCYKDAAYTRRISTEIKLEVIGGADKYMAVCRSCYSKPLTRRSPLKCREDNIKENLIPEETPIKSLFQGSSDVVY